MCFIIVSKLSKKTLLYLFLSLITTSYVHGLNLAISKSLNRVLSGIWFRPRFLRKRKLIRQMPKLTVNYYRQPLLNNF